MNILNSSVDYTKPLGFIEALEFGGQMVLIGMLAVFAVLGLIWAMLSVFKIVFTKNASEPKTSAPTPISVPAPAPRIATDSEIVAVIAAAIAMAENESDDSIKFKVVSFRKK